MILRVLPLALLLLSFSAAGEQTEDTPRWYQFEIIIFSYSDDEGLYSELWPEEPELADYSTARELLPLTVLPLFAEAPAVDEFDIPLNLPPPDEENNDAVLQAETELVDSPDPSLNIQNNLLTVHPKNKILTKKIIPEKPFMLLEKIDRSLNNSAAEFRVKPQYKLLFHQAWRQPVAKHGEATAIRISSLTSNLDHLLGVYDVPQSALNSMKDGESILTPPELEIDGLITPSLNRYLHLDLQLAYRKLIPIETTELKTINSIQDEFLNTPPDENETPTNAKNIETHRYQTFVMQTTRRLRSKQLHYFDHPLFGVLALITPYELAVDEVLLSNDDETLILP